MPLDLPTIRSKFPAMKRPAIFFDNPGGTQVAQPVLDRMNIYLVEHNASHGHVISLTQLVAHRSSSIDPLWHSVHGYQR
ncbi:MAG: hypothetical protein C3F13_01920 [Anaerolineales bacterium]|nr:hypothetical protein [Anaerolineae bacterium]PWB56319.1 MAG: hypothetical protein C3F13_01920 [Anaerolineales bacterium]